MNWNSVIASQFRIINCIPEIEQKVSGSFDRALLAHTQLSDGWETASSEFPGGNQYSQSNYAN